MLCKKETLNMQSEGKSTQQYGKWNTQLITSTETDN